MGNKVKIEYTEEFTFKTEMVEFPEEMVELASLLQESLSEIEVPDGPCSPYKISYFKPIVAKDKKSLIFFADLGKTRTDREIGTNHYKITVEKIEPYGSRK